MLHCKVRAHGIGPREERCCLRLVMDASLQRCVLICGIFSTVMVASCSMLGHEVVDAPTTGQVVGDEPSITVVGKASLNGLHVVDADLRSKRIR